MVPSGQFKLSDDGSRSTYQKYFESAALENGQTKYEKACALQLALRVYALELSNTVTGGEIQLMIKKQMLC